MVMLVGCVVAGRGALDGCVAAGRGAELGPELDALLPLPVPLPLPLLDGAGFGPRVGEVLDSVGALLDPDPPLLLMHDVLL